MIHFRFSICIKNIRFCRIYGKDANTVKERQNDFNLFSAKIAQRLAFAANQGMNIALPKLATK